MSSGITNGSSGSMLEFGLCISFSVWTVPFKKTYWKNLVFFHIFLSLPKSPTFIPTWPCALCGHLVFVLVGSYKDIDPTSFCSPATFLRWLLGLLSQWWQELLKVRSCYSLIFVVHFVQCWWRCRFFLAVWIFTLIASVTMAMLSIKKHRKEYPRNRRAMITVIL